MIALCPYCKVMPEIQIIPFNKCTKVSIYCPKCFCEVSTTCADADIAIEECENEWSDWSDF